jgi:ubiquinone/menaquinone biosynthesis C-methylase UbiE
MHRQDDGWSEYWQQDSADGEVFVNAKGDAHPALATYWARAFAAGAPGARVLDIASGAGSIYAHLPADHGFELHAADIAPEALATLSRRIAGVTTTVASAAEMPFDDCSFDLVLSQFGVEYAGVEAFAEAARVVANEGRLVMLAHIEDGYIDSNNKAQLNEAHVVRTTKFIEQAKVLTETAFKKGGKALLKREKAFVPAIQELVAAQRRCGQGVHAHLLAGFKQLYENRRQYDLADITGWLDGMQGELDKTVDRLSRMRAAALSGSDAEDIRSMLEASGFAEISIEAFSTPGNELPVAWELVAKRAK